ncbi:hypothetical protein ASC89_04330 [Devosia sp. Root413D1]|nr:hypothetical protein ASC89_04330 [Devosia sp. Root413D1]
MLDRLLPSVGLVAVLVLGGCASTSRPPVHSLPVVDCGASEVKKFIGQPVNGKSASDVRIGNNRVRSKGEVRVIAPGPMSMFSAPGCCLAGWPNGRMDRTIAVQSLTMAQTARPSGPAGISTA